MPERVQVFIDGSNAYHAFKTAFGSGRFDPAKLALGLAEGRTLLLTHYYVGELLQAMGKEAYAAQQRFLARLKASPSVRLWLGRMAQTQGVWYEKGVDVQIATHLVAMAYRDGYDVAILVSGDGDLAPAIREVRHTGKRVELAVPPGRRYWHLFQVSSRFIAIDRLLWERCQP